MLDRLLTLDYRRRRLLQRTPAGPLHAFLSTPFPDPGTDARRVDYLALDLETTGVDVREHDILSVGWVGMHGTRIDLATASHHLVRQRGAIPESSAVIHRITDDAAARGEPLEQVLTALLQVLQGKVLLAHHARFEFEFLRSACRRLFGGDLLVPVVDTLWLARQWLERRNRTYAPRDLRLGALRERFHLPRYPAHDALSDAIAAAELYAAQLAHRDGAGTLPLKRVLLH